MVLGRVGVALIVCHNYGTYANRGSGVSFVIAILDFDFDFIFICFCSAKIGDRIGRLSRFLQTSQD